MKEEVRQKIQQIMGRMECPKLFKCADSGFQSLCRAVDIGLEHYLECLDPDRASCPFVQSFGNGYYCLCPLRIYIAKTLKK
jgi:hypothetical protein